MARNPVLFRSKSLALSVALLSSVALPMGAIAETGQAPLDGHPLQLGTAVDTANTLPARGMRVTLGTTQTVPGTGAGTGNQIYYTGVSFAPSDRLSFGLHLEFFEDPVTSPINGAFPAIGMDTAALSSKYKLWDGPNLDVAVQGSVEYFRFETSVFGTFPGPNAEQVIGSFKAPISYSMNDRLQFHLTPGVSVFPETLAIIILIKFSPTPLSFPSSPPKTHSC